MWHSISAGSFVCSTRASTKRVLLNQITEAMYMVRFPSQVISSISFPSFKKTNKQTNKHNKKEKKNMVEASASVFLILATALTF